jgi:plastocyanin
MKQARLLISGASLAVMLGGFAASAGAPPAFAANDGVVIMMTDAFRFEPDNVTIHAGDAVEWRNVSHFNHIVTDDRTLGDATIAAGAHAFSSGEIALEASYRRVLSMPGKYRYFCIPQEGIGMLGQITVLPR